MKSKFLILLCSLCFIFSFNAHALEIKDAVSFDPIPIKVQAANIGVPVGTVIVWTREEVPEGWLECNGQVVNADLYPDLAMLMSSVPDYRDRFLQGKSGQAVGSKIDAGLPNIEATMGNGSWGQYTLLNGAYYTVPRAGEGGIGWAIGGYRMALNFDASRSNSIYGNSSTVQPPAVVVKYIIKAE